MTFSLGARVQIRGTLDAINSVGPSLMPDEGFHRFLNQFAGAVGTVVEISPSGDTVEIIPDDRALLGLVGSTRGGRGVIGWRIADLDLHDPAPDLGNRRAVEAWLEAAS